MSDEQLPPFLRRRAEPCHECSGSGIEKSDGGNCLACGGTRKLATGRLELTLHCTWIQDYYICPRKFWLRYHECVEGTGPRAALNYGGAVHEALRIRYTSPGLSLATAEELQVQALGRWFDAHPQPSDEWRSAGRAQDLIRAYNETYPAHDWEVLAVEEEFEVQVGEIEIEIEVEE